MERVGIQYSLLLCIMSSLRCYRASLFTMLSHDQQYIVDSGAELSLSCVFYKDNFNLFDNPIQWKKIQYGEVSEINILGNIKDPFDSTGRFRVTFQPYPPQYTMGLTIRNISIIDNGNYTCEIRAPKSIEPRAVRYTVYIKDPVQDVYIDQRNSTLTVREVAPSTTSVVFIENQPTPVRCVAHGGSPPPEMSIYLGREEHTKYFRFDLLSVLSGQVGFRTLHITSVLVSDDIRASAEDDGKRLNCVAEVAGLGDVVSSVRVTVNYGPQIQCHPSFAYVGDRNVRLLCDVRAKPELTSWFWILGENGTTISEGEVIDGYWTVVTRSEGTFHLELYIREASRQSFRIYTLMAENIVAIETRQVPLKRLYRHVRTESRSEDTMSQRQGQTDVKSKLHANGILASSTDGRRVGLTAAIIITQTVVFSCLFIAGR